MDLGRSRVGKIGRQITFNARLRSGGLEMRCRADEDSKQQKNRTNNTNYAGRGSGMVFPAGTLPPNPSRQVHAPSQPQVEAVSYAGDQSSDRLPVWSTDGHAGKNKQDRCQGRCLGKNNN